MAFYYYLPWRIGVQQSAKIKDFPEFVICPALWSFMKIGVKNGVKIGVSCGIPVE
ncbi:MAG: hypothetical protein LUF27_05555 [Lachnospiraceae bacterium]|nr:hypothetical protein [Lachnospiraceae bacterium]